MPTLFKVKDPDGVDVTCNKKTWDDHIETRHPELEGHDSDVATAVERPLGVYQSSTHVARRVFYAPSSALSSPMNRGLIRVVVEYGHDIFGRDRGHVITAMHVLRPKQGERIVWPRD